jgi:hypothetical protein
MLWTTLAFCALLLAALLGAPTSIRLLAFALVSGLILKDIYSSPKALSPLRWFGYAWQICLSLYLTDLFLFSSRYEGRAGLLFLAACLAATVGGYALGAAGHREKVKTPAENPSYINHMSRLVTVGALLGLLAGILFSIDMVQRGASVLDQAALRELYSSKEPGILSQIAAVLCPGSFVAICGLFYFGPSVGRPTRSVWLAGGLAGLSLSAWSGGRQMIFQLCLTTLVCLAIRRYLGRSLHVTRKAKVAIALGCVVFILYSVYVGAGRAEADASARPRYVVLEHVFGASVNPEMVQLLDAVPVPVRNGITEAYMYIASPIANLRALYDTDLPRPTYGLYTVPFLTRRVQAFVDLPSPVDRLRELAQAVNDNGLFGSGWATTPGTFLMEFGKVFTVSLCALIGVWFAHTWRCFQRERSFGRMVSLVSASLIALYFPLLPAISDTTIFILVLTGVVLTQIGGRWQRPRPVPRGRPTFHRRRQWNPPDSRGWPMYVGPLPSKNQSPSPMKVDTLP